MSSLIGKKKIISLVMIIIGLPLAITTAASGGGFFAFIFAAILAGGIDLFTDAITEEKKI